MSHVVLLGDSVFDNGSYVRRGEPDVLAQVRNALPEGWQATMRAVDGAATTNMEQQLAKLPADASHLVISIGGNDAMASSGILGEGARSVAEVMTRIADIREAFARNYHRMLDFVMRHHLPTTICTIYDARFPDPEEQRHVVVALSVFNDVIMREAFTRGLSLIDLRLICNEPDDYSNPIEVSAKGGEKVADAVVQAVAGKADFTGSQVYAR